MTVRELDYLLEGYTSDMRVVVNGYELGTMIVPRSRSLSCESRLTPACTNGKDGTEIASTFLRHLQGLSRPWTLSSCAAFRADDSSSQQNIIDYIKFQLPLKRLEAQNGNYRQGNPILSDLDREGIAESVIQRFEACYDCLWKVLKRYLIEEVGIADPPNSPKPAFRLGHV